MAGELILPEVAAPTNPTSGKGLIYTTTASPSRLVHIEDTPASHTILTADSTDAITNKTFVYPAGTTTVAPEQYTSGTNLTNAAVGAVEFDGAAFYKTIDTTTGRRVDDGWQFFRLTANGTPFTSITDFFGTNDGIPTVLNAVYEIEWHCYFAIAVLSTQVVTWTIVNTQTVTNMVAGWAAMTALANGATAGALTGAALVTQTAASVALPASGVITIGNHYHVVKALIEAGTAGNVRLRAATASTATIGALRDSYLKVRRLPAGNAGTFVA